MSRGEVGPEAREDETVGNGKCFHGVGDMYFQRMETQVKTVLLRNCA